MLLFLCLSLCPTGKCIHSAASAAAAAPSFPGIRTQLLWPSNIKTSGSPEVLQAFITKSELLKHPASQIKLRLGSWALQHTRLFGPSRYSNLTKTPLRYIFILSVLSLQRTLTSNLPLQNQTVNKALQRERRRRKSQNVTKNFQNRESSVTMRLRKSSSRLPGSHGKKGKMEAAP